MSVYTRYICVHPNSQIHREHIPLTSGVSCPYPSILGGHLKASMVITACFSSPRIISLTAGCHPLTSVYWVWRGPNRTLILKWCVPWGTITNLPEDYWSSCSLKLPPAYLSCTIFSPSGLSAVKTWRVLFFFKLIYTSTSIPMYIKFCVQSPDTTVGWPIDSGLLAYLPYMKHYDELTLSYTVNLKPALATWDTSFKKGRGVIWYNLNVSSPLS